jgi:hypothetical protein
MELGAIIFEVDVEGGNFNFTWLFKKNTYDDFSEE